MRLAPVVAGGFVVAAAAMAVAAFTGGEDDEGAAPRPAVTGTAAVRSSEGLDIWVEQGCGSCHRLAAAGSEGEFGPSLDLSLRGRSAAYVKESIVAPGAAAAAGFEPGMMPEDYASRMSPEELDALVAFLVD